LRDVGDAGGQAIFAPGVDGVEIEWKGLASFLVDEALAIFGEEGVG